MQIDLKRNWVYLKSKYNKYVGKVLKYFSNDNQYIVVIDGGICSQMDQYIVGNYLESLGYKIQYDLSWYECGGVDILGEQERNFDLLKLFPYLKLEIASKDVIARYKKYYLYYNPWDNCVRDIDKLPNPPKYLAGYGYELVANKREKYSQIFKINLESLVLNQENFEMLDAITKEDAVGMHVRRGDLADGSIYREAIPKEYFIKAIKKFEGRGKLFVFSDGMEWVRKELNDILPKDTQLVEINQSDKGWCDLLLMSRCKYQIASQGSMGYHAFLLNKNENKMICVPDKIFARRIIEFNQIREDEVYYL